MFDNHPPPRDSLATKNTRVRKGGKGEVYLMVRGFPTGHLRSDHGEALWCLLLDGTMDDGFAIDGGTVQIVSQPILTKAVKRGDQAQIGESDGTSMPAYFRALPKDQWIASAPVIQNHVEAQKVPVAPGPRPTATAPSNNPKEGDRFKTKYGQAFVFKAGSWTPDVEMVAPVEAP